ncbi:uncharacterized protein LOC117648215 [Thrips palmi]|uniref:Uncharacterized protein LOC117648215 n=1 Tax=Thrips palmi TaxID=161013 RepID=A0A6P8Z8A1_THRPL|nr:uncharacterized protein LOC117648215 [Thrips palmi]XP_034246485.1 uncharacterized protein LOC117648215 [Thrips palmi]XP_034246486.1 uncharacterized protein LOC117648215 [Thrips palmi]
MVNPRRGQQGHQAADTTSWQNDKSSDLGPRRCTSTSGTPGTRYEQHWTGSGRPLVQASRKPLLAGHFRCELRDSQQGVEPSRSTRRRTIEVNKASNHRGQQGVEPSRSTRRRTIEVNKASNHRGQQGVGSSRSTRRRIIEVNKASDHRGQQGVGSSRSTKASDHRGQQGVEPSRSTRRPVNEISKTSEHRDHREHRDLLLPCILLCI